MPELEIHHINVSQGDSTLIINRDIDELGTKIDAAINKKKSLIKPPKKEDFLPFAILNKISLKGTVRQALLIDAGDDIYGGDVAKYIVEQGVETKKFITVATHYHADHVGGFRDVFYKGYDSTKLLNNQTPNLVPTTAYDCGDLKAWDRSSTRGNYIKIINELSRRWQTKRANFDLNKSYELGCDKNNQEIKYKVIASNGTVSKNDSNSTSQIIKPKQSPDQNARSIVLVFEYGDFRYFLGGDIGGTGEESGGNFGENKDTRAKKFYSSHPDIETSITKLLPKIYKKNPNRTNTVDGHVCVHSANHHGSASSNDVFLIEAMNPKVVTCSSGVRLGFHGHPTQQFFQRTDCSNRFSPKWQEPGNTKVDKPTVNNTVDGYYITEMAELTNTTNKKYGHGKSAKGFNRNFPKGNILGDIIVRPISAVVPVNKNGANSIKIQIYGTGLGTDATVTSIPTEKFTAHTNNPYPIGPFFHNCDKH